MVSDGYYAMVLRASPTVLTLFLSNGLTVEEPADAVRRLGLREGEDCESPASFAEILKRP